jgi:endogenous inhibitor of DNA gyrase (YacG/DUF329 family)
MLCPTCGKPAQWQDNPARPFCSERCKLIDLGRWVDEEYRVPSEPVNTEELHPEEQPRDKSDAEWNN